MIRTPKKIELVNSRTDVAKEAIWELVLWLWGVQCNFMASVKAGDRLMRDQAKAWRVRAIAISKTLSRDADIDTKSFVELLHANIIGGGPMSE